MNKSSIGLKQLNLSQYRIFEYLLTFLAVIIIYILSGIFDIKNDEAAVKPIMTTALILLVCYGFFIARKGKLDCNRLTTLIVIAGMIMGIGYCIYSDVLIRGHDNGSLSVDATGHLAYILNLYEGRLPDSNSYQFYHPPLVHLLSSIVMRIAAAFTGGNINDAAQYIQIVNCSAYCFMLLAFKNFITEIELKEEYQPLVMTIIAFFPNYYFMGGRANNDMFSLYFFLLCVINTFRWYRDRDFKSIVFLALSFGLGMMSKISCGVIALFTGSIMIYCLVKAIKTNKYRAIVLQLAIFAAICFPLALWFPIRNYVLFDQPLNYVVPLGENHPIYTGNVEWYRRFFEFSLIDMLKNPFFQFPGGYSIPEHVVRTSMFGEWSFGEDNLMCQALLVINVLMIVISTVSMIYVVVDGKELSKRFRFGLFAVWAISFGSFIQFNIAYPYMCTADFRYIGITGITGAVFIGYALQTLEKRNLTCKSIICKISKILVALFAATSMSVFM